jgi:hypothetical protein
MVKRKCDLQKNLICFQELLLQVIDKSSNEIFLWLHLFLELPWYWREQTNSLVTFSTFSKYILGYVLSWSSLKKNC